MNRSIRLTGKAAGILILCVGLAACPPVEKQVLEYMNGASAVVDQVDADLMSGKIKDTVEARMLRNKLSDSIAVAGDALAIFATAEHAYNLNPEDSHKKRVFEASREALKAAVQMLRRDRETLLRFIGKE